MLFHSYFFSIRRFAEEDSENNIMFDEKNGGQGPLIKAGTIYKLVERLTFHEYAGLCFIKSCYACTNFLFTFIIYTKPEVTCHVVFLVPL